MLFANLTLTCSMPAVDVPLVLSCLHDSSAIAANFELDIVSVACFLAHFAKKNDLFNFSSTFNVGVIFLYNTRALAADFERFTVSI